MAEEKVIYIENEKQSDWNFGTYFRSIKRFKWWVIGATVISAVLGFLAFKFIVNPSSKTLVATFSYDLAATPEGENSFRFIDGTLFNYYDIVSKENLIAVKDGQKDLFHSIDANVLYAGNEIKIEKVSVKDGNSAQESVAFKIRAKSKSFTSDKVGKEYLYALINHPKSISSQAINNYSIPSLTDELNSVLPYEKQLSILEEQYQTIENAYSSLETVFGQAAIVNGEGESLNVASNKFKTMKSFMNSYHI